MLEIFKNPIFFSSIKILFAYISSFQVLLIDINTISLSTFIVIPVFISVTNRTIKRIVLALSTIQFAMFFEQIAAIQIAIFTINIFLIFNMIDIFTSKGHFTENISIITLRILSLFAIYIQITCTINMRYIFEHQDSTVTYYVDSLARTIPIFLGTIPADIEGIRSLLLGIEAIIGHILTIAVIATYFIRIKRS